MEPKYQISTVKPTLHINASIKGKSENTSPSNLPSKGKKKRTRKRKSNKGTSLSSSNQSKIVADSYTISVNVMKNAASFSKSSSDFATMKEPEAIPVKSSNSSIIEILRAARFESINISDTNPELFSAIEKLNNERIDQVMEFYKNSPNVEPIEWVILTDLSESGKFPHLVASIENLPFVNEKMLDPGTKFVKIFVISKDDDDDEPKTRECSYFKTTLAGKDLREIVDTSAIDHVLNMIWTKETNFSSKERILNTLSTYLLSCIVSVKEKEGDTPSERSTEISNVKEIFIDNTPSMQGKDSPLSSLQSPEPVLSRQHNDSASEIDFPCRIMPTDETNSKTEYQHKETRPTSPVLNVPSPTRIELAQSLLSLASQEIVRNSPSITTSIELSDFSNKNRSHFPSSSKPEYSVHSDDVPGNENMKKQHDVFPTQKQPISTEINKEYERRPFFYISSSEIKDRELPTISGDFQVPSQRPDNSRYIEERPFQEPRRCLGSQRCHYIILTVGIIGAIMGCVIYHLQGYGIGPYALRPIGASTALISFVICVISSIYIRYLSRNSKRRLPSNYEPIDGTNSSSSIQNNGHPGGYWNERGQWVPEARPGYYQNSNEGPQAMDNSDRGACGESQPETKGYLSNEPSTSGYNRTSEGSKRESSAGTREEYELKSTGTNVNQGVLSCSEDEIFNALSLQPQNDQGNF